MPDKTAPPAPDPHSGKNPGYAESQPRDKRDVKIDNPRPQPNPDDGGVNRDPEVEADPAREDD
ncbi:MAG: hypothetical protein M3Q11_01490 [Pseudomonadota bacterium]|nr:hypothetical protein [Pseudomonadota bacterium]